MLHFKSLDEPWSLEPSTLHDPKTLQRFCEAMEVLKIPKRLAPLTLLVSGTNGKSSACQTLEVVAQHHGKRFASLTSPYLFHPRERIRISGSPLAAEVLEKLGAAYPNLADHFHLSPSDHLTLLAFKLFDSISLDLLVIEVEMGFRCSPAQALDSDLALITGIDYDHLELLGKNRERIGFEKSGIFRRNKLAVIADKDPPATLHSEVELMEVKAYWQGKDWSFHHAQVHQWVYSSIFQNSRMRLPLPSLSLNSVAAALFSWELLMGKLEASKVATWMPQLFLPGHFQKVPGEPLTLLDVASNPQAIRLLFRRLLDLEVMHNIQGWQLICAMQEDSLMEESLMGLSFHRHFQWHLPQLSPDFESPENLQAFFLKTQITHGPQAVAQSLHRARLQAALHNNGVLVFGSTALVAEALRVLQPPRMAPYVDALQRSRPS